MSSAPPFPRKEQRMKCYTARDQFWSCLDKFTNDQLTTTNDPKTAEQIGMENCRKFKELFEADCPPQWVTHFNRKYKYLKFKEKIESGFDPVQDDSGNK